MNTVKVLWIITLKFNSYQLTEYTDIPKAVIGGNYCTVVDNKIAAPSVADSNTVEVKAILIDDEDSVYKQFDNGDDASLTTFKLYLHNYTVHDYKFNYRFKFKIMDGYDGEYLLGRRDLNILLLSLVDSW